MDDGGDGTTTATATRVYSIREAVAELSQRRSLPPPNHRQPVDVLGIVTATCVQPTSHRYGNHNNDHKECVQFLDEEGSAAFITLHTNKGSSPAPRSLRVGDVCRFNRVSLKRPRRSEPENTEHNNSKTEPIRRIPHFWHSWEDPEPGMEWCILGHVANHHNNTAATASLMGRPLHIPTSMQTAPDQVNRVIACYRGTTTSSKRTSSSHYKTPPSLSQLPCRLRSMEELISCVGSTGNVIAKVEKIIPASAILSMRNIRRPSKYTPKRITPGSAISYAILSEGNRGTTTTTTSSSSAALVTLVVSEPRFLTVLQKAQRCHGRIRLTAVRSQPPPGPGCSGGGIMGSSTTTTEDIVLYLTANSQVTLLVTNNPSDPVPALETQLDRCAAATTDDTGGGDGSQSSGTSLKTMTFSACLRSIRPASTTTTTTKAASHNWTGGGTSSITEIVNRVLVGRKTTKQTTWFLVELSGVELGGTSLLVYANQDIVWQLCGGCSDRQKQTLTVPVLSTTTAAAFLEGLLLEETQLQWVVEWMRPPTTPTATTSTSTSTSKETSQWHVTAVSFLQVLH